MPSRRCRLLPGPAVIVCLVVPASGADEPGAARQARAPRADSFVVDLDASRVSIKVAPAGRLGHAHGVAGRLSGGTIELGGRGGLTFAMASFDADDPEARRSFGLEGTVSAADRRKINRAMLGPDVLDAARFPSASFAYTAAVPLDGQPAGRAGRYRLDGRLTLRGVTRPLTLTAVAEPIGSGDALRMRCAFSVLQSEYGITPYSTLGGLVGVADRLEIRGELVVRPPSGRPHTGRGEP